MLDSASLPVAAWKQVKYQWKRGTEKLNFCIEIISSEDSLKKAKSYNIWLLFTFFFFDQKNIKKKRF